MHHNQFKQRHDNHTDIKHKKYIWPRTMLKSIILFFFPIRIKIENLSSENIIRSAIEVYRLFWPRNWIDIDIDYKFISTFYFILDKFLKSQKQLK